MEVQTPNYKTKFQSQRHCHELGAHQEMKSKEQARLEEQAKPGFTAILAELLPKTGFQERQETCIKLTPNGTGMHGMKLTAH